MRLDMLRGLESVVAAVLLIVVAVLGVVLVYWLFSGYVGRFTGVAGQAVAAEMFKVESASLAADGTVGLFIRNIGGAPVNVSTIYVHPLGSLNPLCVKHGINTVISPGTLAAVETMLTCTPSPAPGGSYVIKVVTARGTEYTYVVTTTSTLAAGGGGDGGSGGGGVCSFVSSSGRRFGSPDGSPAAGFNELNGWVAAWGPSSGGVRIALMPGITPPDSTNTGHSYTVELNDVEIGTLTVSGGTAGVSIEEPMPDFMDVVNIRLEPGEYILYDNGPRPVVVAPGTYQVKATLRAKPRSDIYGRTADLTLTCGGAPTATITLRVPNPNEWGLRADIYRLSGFAVWPPFEDNPSHYTHRGTWSVGAIYFWLDPVPGRSLGVSSPYFSGVLRSDSAPKWAAYWIDPAATSWTHWAIKFTGNLYVPWRDIQVGVWHDDGVYVKLCNINTSNSRWYHVANPAFYRVNGACSVEGVHSVEVGYFKGTGSTVLVFIIGPGTGNNAYIPTIDGAWFCPNFRWTGALRGTCSAAWSFVPASPSAPHFVADSYTPGSTDGGGTPLP